MKKNILVITLIFFLANCGFTPVYLKNTDVNFSIEQVVLTGDKELNNFLKTNLNQYKNKKIDNKIYIEANSIYKKIILSKDGAGKVTNYQLEAEVIFIIKPLNKKIIITDKKIMKSIDDQFEEPNMKELLNKVLLLP
jgi:outer membrane lipopolysaccharide assembly protein LptE/RlpB